MTVAYLTRRLTDDTRVIIKSNSSLKTLWAGPAKKAIFGDKVKDWDFSDEHIIYV